MCVIRRSAVRFSFEFTFKGHLLRRDGFTSWDDAENAEISARQMLGVWTTLKRKKMIETRKKSPSLRPRTTPFPPAENDPISERWNQEIVETMLKNIPHPTLQTPPSPTPPTAVSIQTQTDEDISHLQQENDTNDIDVLRELLDMERSQNAQLASFLDATTAKNKRLVDIIDGLRNRS